MMLNANANNSSLPDALAALAGTEMEGWLFLESVDVERRARLRQFMVPLAIQYGGLGLYRVLEYVPHKQGFFIHIDGGSNDYDRSSHATHWNAYCPDDQEVMTGTVRDVILDDANAMGAGDEQ